MPGHLAQGQILKKNDPVGTSGGIGNSSADAVVGHAGDSDDVVSGRRGADLFEKKKRSVVCVF